MVIIHTWTWTNPYLAVTLSLAKVSTQDDHWPRLTQKWLRIQLKRMREHCLQGPWMVRPNSVARVLLGWEDIAALVVLTLLDLAHTPVWGGGWGSYCRALLQHWAQPEGYRKHIEGNIDIIYFLTSRNYNITPLNWLFSIYLLIYFILLNKKKVKKKIRICTHIAIIMQNKSYTWQPIYWIENPSINFETCKDWLTMHL